MKHPWVDGLTIGQALARTAEAHGEAEAVVFPRLDWRRTYREFLEDVTLVARALLALGVGRGEHVGIWSTNQPQWVLLQFATAMIGSPLVNINPAYRAHELEYVLRQADITTLVLTDRFKTSDYHAILEKVCPELDSHSPGALEAAKCPRLKRVVSIRDEPRPGVLGWREFLDGAGEVASDRLARRIALVKPADVVNLQYTSGTTGFPKGVQLTHRNLLMNAFYVGERMNIGAADRVCIPVPFYHCFGCVMGTLMCAVHGAAMVIPNQAFDAEATLRAVEAERCTALYGVPSMFIAELGHPDFGRFDLSQLRTGIMAGSPCPVQIMRQVQDRMGIGEITIAYGLTEASPVITQTRTDDGLRERVETVGKELPGVEVRLVEPGTDLDVAEGEQGELLVRGHGVMKGYYNNPEATAKALSPDGWLRTGDLAARSPNGFYRITGRIKDMLIRGGENVYPREIEEFLHTHPEIADVQVVGLPDQHFGEEVSAWIIPKPGARLAAEEVREFCRDRIAHFKIPRHVFFVSDYPTTVTGKVQKFKLREMGIERLGLKDG